MSRPVLDYRGPADASQNVVVGRAGFKSAAEGFPAMKPDPAWHEVREPDAPGSGVLPPDPGGEPSHGPYRERARLLRAARDFVRQVRSSHLRRRRVALQAA